MVSTHELKAKAYELSAGVCRPGEADELIGELAGSGELLQLEDGTWTTRELRKLEETTVEIAERRATEIAAPVNEQSLQQAQREIGKQIKGPLTCQQRDALETITGPGAIAVLVGPAGTGKGVVISTAARAWQLEGVEVIGTSVAGATAQRLHADASLDRSYSSDELHYGIQQGRIRIGPNTVIVFDEAAMADHQRIAPLVKLTAERGAKPVLVGDAAQLSSIGPGGLFAALQGRIPTAELHEVHRANHEWERTAWQQIRAGEPGPALAQYQAHDRLHIHDTRAQATEAMVQNWDETRKTLANGQAVMITDASNIERDQMNAMAQDRRAQAGELGAHQVELPGKPYGLRAGDEIIFTAKYPVPGEQRIKNGITATVIDAGRHEDKVTIKTNEHEPRDVEIDTGKFSDLSLNYAMHVNKGQGTTAETSGILIGGWQTDKEHAYVTVSRAREQTQIYVSREDLGEQGFDTGALERLAEKIKRSRAQAATITKNVAERGPERQQTAEREDQPEHDSGRLRAKRRPQDRVADEDGIVRDPRDRDIQLAEDTTPEPVPHAHSATQSVPIDIQKTTPEEIQITTHDIGDIKLAHSQVYDLSAHTDEPTHTLFGAWQTEHEQGFVTATQSPDGTDVQISREERGERDIETELTDRIGQVILRSQAREASPAQEPSAPEAGRELQHDHPAQLEPATHDTDTANDQATDTSRDPDHQPEREPVERDPYIEQAIQHARERQHAWEHGIEQERENDRENDRGYGIE